MMREARLPPLMRRMAIVTTACLSPICIASDPASAQAWMSPDVATAHSAGYKGQNTTVLLVDDFSKGYRWWLRINYWGFFQHGEAMNEFISSVAPEAKIRWVARSMKGGQAVVLSPGLNILNLSFRRLGYPGSDMRSGAQINSIVQYIRQGAAVGVKSAGNLGSSMARPYSGPQEDLKGTVDLLSGALKSSPSVLYVGALDRNGTPTNKARLSQLSNYPGSDSIYQSRYLSVGVHQDQLRNLDGSTSAAAAIVSGYAAVVGSKFKNATPTQVANQLLKTARQDTVANYAPAIYGRGEASLSRALAPASLK